MIILDIPQGDLRWIMERLWRLTASEMGQVITSTGKLSTSEAAMHHIDKLIAGIELVSVMQGNVREIGEMDDYQLSRYMEHYVGKAFRGNAHSERGHECEPDAIAAMSALLCVQVMPVGMVVMGDSTKGTVSCSPDGRISDGGSPLVAGAEVKAPCLHNFYKIVREGGLPSQYKLQVHASMAICEVDEWHFGAFFTGKDLYYQHVKWDDYTSRVRDSLVEFQDVYARRYAELQEALAKLKPHQE